MLFVFPLKTFPFILKEILCCTIFFVVVVVVEAKLLR